MPPLSPKKSLYDAEKVRTLSSLEHIRLRSGMYIGRLGDGSTPHDGIYVLLKEVIDNAVDEFLAGYGKKLEIQQHESGLAIRDYGRGIPLEKVIECASQINTGAKFNNEVFQFSVGLNGVGIKAVNALSSHFLIRSHREGAYVEARFERGHLVASERGSSPKQSNGTYVEFSPDEAIFPSYKFNLEFIEQQLWRYCCLNRGLTLLLGKKRFVAQKGLEDFLEREIGPERIYPLLYRRERYLEFCFTHSSNYGEACFSFVNGQYTSDGGTHLAAFREGLVKAAGEFFKRTFTAVDMRDGLLAAVAIKIQEPVFESQTKNKLANTDVRPWIVAEVKKSITDLLYKNPQSADLLREKLLTNESLRKELATVRKKSRIASKRVALTIHQLKDCRYHLSDKHPRGKESVLFITEGQSATGPIVSCRDTETQAIYSLRGKPWNAFGKKRAEIYRNEELYNLMVALGIENDIEGLRYQQIILATDADNDGFHIRNLLLTFFLNYFEDLVLNQHVFILETPLFRVRNKKQTIYCYSIQERDLTLSKLKNAEVTRFKGLGEISPKEFGPFIGSERRLIAVDVKSLRDIHKTLNFYMGKNTPDRYEYIMGHLI